jgi:hypothetical protein
MNIDRSEVNFENLSDAPGSPIPSNKNVFGSKKQKKNQGPALNLGGKKSGPSKKVGKATKTSGKFPAAKSGKVQGKGNNKQVR